MKLWRKIYIMTAALAVSVMLGGCGSKLHFALDPQDLYALPELPAQYTELNSQLNAILTGGAEYAAPTSGTNVQPVQMVDLDGDGNEETIAFFRSAGEEKPLKIHIFSVQGSHYEPVALIEGSGTSISSIAYSDLDCDGRTEIVVGWRVNAELQALSVYSLRPSGAEELLRSASYVKYAVTDLDLDGFKELVLLHSDEEGSGIADYYRWGPDGAVEQSAAAVSVTMAQLSRQGRISNGKLPDGTPALFVTGVTEKNRIVTDILALREGALDNLFLSEITGVSRIIADFNSLYPADLNGDGYTEVPSPVELPLWSENSIAYRRIDWMQFSADGTVQTMLRTYHDLENKWYLRLPEEWTDRIMVSRSTMTDETVVSFYIRKEGAESPQPFLRIASITGTNRDIRALRGGRFILSRQLETTYTAELLEANEVWEYGLTPDQVRSAFSLIATEWNTD